MLEDVATVLDQRGPIASGSDGTALWGIVGDLGEQPGERAAAIGWEVAEETDLLPRNKEPHRFGPSLALSCAVHRSHWTLYGNVDDQLHVLCHSHFIALLVTFASAPVVGGTVFKLNRRASCSRLFCSLDLWCSSPTPSTFAPAHPGS